MLFPGNWARLNGKIGQKVYSMTVSRFFLVLHVRTNSSGVCAWIVCMVWGYFAIKLVFCPNFAWNPTNSLQSIINKVKTRVSNIFPSVASWFSSPGPTNNGGVRRRRDSDSDSEQETTEENVLPHSKRRKSDVVSSNKAFSKTFLQFLTLTDNHTSNKHTKWQ